MTVDAPALRARRAEFVALLRDARDGDASVGFVRPLAESSPQVFWDDVAAGVDEGTRKVLAVEQDGRIVGGGIAVSQQRLGRVRHGARPCVRSRAHAGELRILLQAAGLKVSQ
jgi:hypothetical protein